MIQHSRVLLVDDDPVFLAVAEAVVTALGIADVTCASNGADGLECLRSRDPDFSFIILDLNMPELDGLAFMRGAAELGFKGGIIVSSGESEAVIRSARHMGEMLGVRIIGCLKKPLSTHDLRALLNSAAAGGDQDRPPFRGSLPSSLHSLELVPYYQAQHDAWNGSIRGAEALIRARDQQGTIHGPGKLFSLVHGHGELVRMTLDIARKVMDDALCWRTAGVRVCAAINVDARVAEEPEVGATIARLAHERSLDPTSLCLELTETALPVDMTRLIEALTRLRMVGFQLSLDDYGTGGSNFELLRLCPFTEIKIDGSVIRAAASEPIAHKFLDSAVAMASDLGLNVIGEGIETAAQLDLARQSGIAVIQGYLFSRPTPADDLLRMLQAERLRRAS